MGAVEAKMFTAEGASAVFGDILDDEGKQVEPEIREAIRMALRYTHNLVEGAGAASIAAARQLREELVQQTVVMVITGGNLDLATLKEVLV